MFITVFYKDYVVSTKARLRVQDIYAVNKEVLITILTIFCEPGYSSGSNSNVYNILKMKKN